MKNMFASDNTAPVHPDVLRAMSDANIGHEISYGEDPYTAGAVNAIKEAFGCDLDVYFVYNGTGANVLGLSAVIKSFGAVVCPESSHINIDECGAAEKYAGIKLLLANTDDGKLKISHIKERISLLGIEHHSQPMAVSITQSTEMGTLYTVEEIRAISDFAHSHGLFVHMDGARIANAVAALGISLYDMTGGAGVDVLSFGSTKNGLMFGEAVIFFKKDLGRDFKYIRKQGMQLSSKMRYIAAGFSAILKGELWRRNASHSNEMAKLLYHGLNGIKGIQPVREPQVNSLFVHIEDKIAEELFKEYFFYNWDESKKIYRLMTTFATEEKDINEFVSFAAAVSK